MAFKDFDDQFNETQNNDTGMADDSGTTPMGSEGGEANRPGSTTDDSTSVPVGNTNDDMNTIDDMD